MDMENFCQKCGNSGWALVEGTSAVERCACQHEIRIAKLLKRSNIPERYINYSLGSYSPNNASQKNAKLIAQKFLDSFPSVENFGRGICFIGPVGIGKTHISVAILKNIITEKAIDGLFYGFRSLLKEIQASWNEHAQTSQVEIFRHVMDATVLVLDELGADMSTPWINDTVSYIIESRYNDQKITIFTSNFPDKPISPGAETLTDRIGTRLRSRLYEMCHTVYVSGEDFRKNVKNSSF